MAAAPFKIPPANYYLAAVAAGAASDAIAAAPFRAAPTKLPIAPV
jgi:hypothetical protein